MSRLFELIRSKDISGVSGTGVVAEGVEFTDGSIALRWKGNHPATAVWPSLADVLAVHGHQGDTVVRWVGEPPELVDLAGALAKVTNVIDSGLPFTSMAVNSYSYSGGHAIKLHIFGKDGWLSWLAALGGSADAAVCADWPHGASASAKWQWTSPDGLIQCFYLTDNPGELNLSEEVSDADTV